MNNPGEFLAAMMSAAGKDTGNAEVEISPEITARRLLDHYDQLVTAHEFKLGQLAQLKPGFGTEYNRPSAGTPVIITELIDPPYVDPERRSGAPQCMVGHDVRIGLVDSDGGFVQFVFCSRFLEPYTGKIEP